MKTRDKIIMMGLFAVIFTLIAIGPTALRAVDSLTWEGVLPSIFTGTSGTEAINVAITDSTAGLKVDGGDFIFNDDSGDYDARFETDSTANAILLDSGNSTFETNGVTVTLNQGSADVDFIVESDTDAAALKVDAGLDAIVHGAWDAYTIVTTTSQSYSLTSTGKAGFFVQTAGEACTFHLMTALLTSPGAGALFTIKTGDASDMTIDTEGSETINGAATYVLDGTQETVTILSDGTNYHVVGGYLE